MFKTVYRHVYRLFTGSLQTVYIMFTECLQTDCLQTCLQTVYRHLNILFTNCLQMFTD